MSEHQDPKIPRPSYEAADNQSPASPFHDRFQFENAENVTLDNSMLDRSGNEPSTAPSSASRGGSIMRKQGQKKRTANRIMFADGDKPMEYEEFSRESDEDDAHSFTGTPKIANSATFGGSDSLDPGSADVKPSSDQGLKRMRWGTKRTKKGTPSVGRAKTLRWAKKNFHNPFEDDRKTDTDDESGAEYDPTNRSSELRFLYYNMPLPEEYLDEEGKPATDYARNKIRTTKYTPLSFFPKNIALQFKNVANVYFLVLIILGFVDMFGVTNPGLQTVPLIVIVVLTAIKDAVEDSQRTILDMEVNNTATHILSGVENPNVSEDHVSAWRRFKKANSRVLFKLIEFCKSTFSKEGRRAAAQRKREEHHAKSARTPRNSLETFDSYRMSGTYGRESLEYDNIGEIVTSDEVTVIDRSMPARTDCKFEKNYWKNVHVGDIIRIHNDDEIPADVLLLSSSDSDGGCYVETKNLDGETNLKVRQSLRCTHRIRNSRDVTRTKFWLESEGPHANLYSYQGNLKWVDSEDGKLKNEPVNINNLLLRGCSLRNTKWAMGLVIFTGAETKIMLNAGSTPTKRSRISRELNFSVVMNFLLLFILCLVAGIVNGIYYRKSGVSRDYFEFGTVAGSPAANGVVSFWVAVILYQSLVPISLYISVEIIKTAQAAFIYGDVLLYNEKLDYPCTPKSWNISDDLGQIEYIFSDKTGTLTQNVMEFKKCTINGISYGRAYTEALAGLRKRQGIDVEKEALEEREAIANDKKVMIKDLEALNPTAEIDPEEITFISKEFVQDLSGANGDYQKGCNEHFMLALALCHSVLVEKSKKNPDKLELKAQSPDEAALVGTAKEVGFAFAGKTKSGLIVEIQGVKKEFEILNILEFNSTRKRMSCIIKLQGTAPGSQPRALLICKGADSVIYSRLKRTGGANEETLLEKTALHLEQYATEGLRTLCIGQRELSWKEYEEWNRQYEIAAASLTEREEEMEKVADSIERNLTLLGGTAIEDRLQDGVPDSIAILGEAGIKLWVLTGDKVETAINIGFSCNLLNSDMELLVIKASGDDVDEVGSPYEIVDSMIKKHLNDKFGLSGSLDELEAAKNEHKPPTGNYGVVIDGEALKLALENDDISRRFLILCKNCRAVLCCRVSPAQKAAVVKLVKESLDVMTLAIGDGSNDVAMIQSADVGIGIAGEEGRQAVMSSDYAIGQFRYLTRLLLVHGRWSYKRLAEMIPSFFYKNAIFTLSLFWYGIYSNYDGAYLFEFTYLMFYNLAFTSLPVIFMGIMDQDVSDVVSLLVPQLYRAGIMRSEWNQTKFWGYMFDGLYQSVICFFFPYLVYYKTGLVTPNGLGLDHRYWVGIIVTTIAALSCNLYVLIHQYRWDWFSSLFIFLSIIIVFGWTGIWSSSTNSGEFYKSAARVYGSPMFWAVMFVGILFCLLPRFTFDVFQKLFFPRDIDIIREFWKEGHFDQYPPDYDPTDPNRPQINKATTTLHSHRIEEGSDFARVAGAGNNMSRDTVYTEEIPMNFINSAESSPEQFHRKSIARMSLERTREQMRASNELDARYSVERARISHELPGVTRAESLMRN
ncbi:aminophospholipid-translocating P4-type ATPase DNF1 [Lachancea thermotolerans CBS 6340]|uniref:Phospholipid-transporting ATPase n=1 Tax=Lachancea thermotolerans (strain ATCC 56472 / CBS 6340 / NRRL Y-8284) TaxID=559295 RepID=C5DN59_LACTC|nr:KLTH0G14388p [Lachancea thermotolerans CBS 6340]CAR25220.1 KLTH0G14388p [Lachancea thermotolerans CBS 6340]